MYLTFIEIIPPKKKNNIKKNKNYIQFVFNIYITIIIKIVFFLKNVNDDTQNVNNKKKVD
jgi:hypothetical protein